MPIDLTAFVFDGGELTFDAEKDHVARIPPGLGNRELLFDALSRELQLPDYFGKNWDALFECLRDFWWIKCHRVIILHADLPPLDTKTITAYLDILSDSVRDWKPAEDHELVAVFPRNAYGAIAAIVEGQGPE